MFSWLFPQRRTSVPATPKSAVSDLAMRVRIAAKLRNYNADEDTTVSEFSLAGDKKPKEPNSNNTSTRDCDVWGQANPRETGKWNKEIRQNRKRVRVGRHPTKLG